MVDSLFTAYHRVHCRSPVALQSPSGKSILYARYDDWHDLRGTVRFDAQCSHWLHQRYVYGWSAGNAIWSHDRGICRTLWRDYGYFRRRNGWSHGRHHKADDSADDEE